MKSIRRQKRNKKSIGLNKRLAAILFLTAVLCVLIYLSVSLDIKNEEVVSGINIHGCEYLEGARYAEFARLADPNDLKYVDLSIIKDRIEKHPYVKKAYVKYSDVELVDIEVVEKTMECVMMTGNNQYLLTDDFEVLPYMNYTKNIDLPVINEPLVDKKVIPGSSLRGNNDIVSAFKIFVSLRKINPELYKNLNEIELRKGKDILLSFTNNDFRVIMGRGNEIMKVVCLDEVWKSLRRKEIYESLNYIDLRFDGFVYLGYS